MYNPQLRYDLKSTYDDDSHILYYQNKAGVKSDHKLKTQSEFESDAESEIDYNLFITEDDEPVDNMFSEHQQRLLPESLYTSWNRDKPFLVSANVGIYEKQPTTPIVPDVFLSLDVKPADDIWQKKHRCYFISIFGKPPELVIEIVSNKVGKERRKKRLRYQNMGVKYYVIYDPGLHVYKTSLHAYRLMNQSYVAFSRKDIQKKRLWFEDIEIGLTIQKGNYEEMNAEWLRWYDAEGKILKTGREKAAEERNKAEQERKKAEQERKKAKKLETKIMAEKNRNEKTEMKLKEEKKRADAAEKELAVLKAKLSCVQESY